MHQNSKLLFEKYGAPLIKGGMQVLEIGPNSFPSAYKQMVDDDTIVWETIDLYDSPKLTYKALDEYHFPIPDAQFDVVLSGQVIEHVRKVWLWTREVARVCKPGGLVITINPVSWGYHEAPVDCWRIYPEGMKALYEDAGLEMQMSKYESLEAYLESYDPVFRSPYYLMKQAIKRLLGRKPELMTPVVDTISIGMKRVAEAPRGGAVAVA
jgi:SAM-dependent methyltransferase